MKESASFDLLLAARLQLTPNDKSSTAVLDHLPEMQIPQTHPESLEKTRIRREDIRRQTQWPARLRGRIATFADWIGFVFTAIFLLGPFSLVKILEQLWGNFHLGFLLTRANNLTKRGKAAAALPLFQRLLERKGYEPTVWNDYAIAQTDLGQFDEAVRAFREAIRLGAGQSYEYKIWFGLGRVLWLADRDEEALEPWDKVLAMAPQGSMEYREAQKGRQFCLDNIRNRASGNSVIALKQRD